MFEKCIPKEENASQRKKIQPEKKINQKKINQINQKKYPKENISQRKIFEKENDLNEKKLNEKRSQTNEKKCLFGKRSYKTRSRPFSFHRYATKRSCAWKKYAFEIECNV